MHIMTYKKLCQIIDEIRADGRGYNNIIIGYFIKKDGLVRVYKTPTKFYIFIRKVFFDEIYISLI